jgi:hypothetical protein
MSEYSIVDLTPTVPAPTPEPTPRPLDAREDLLRLLEDWSVRHDLPVDEYAIIALTADTLTVTMDGLTLNGSRIVVTEREYEYEATILVEVTVRGSVTARSEDDATEQAEATCEDMAFDIDAYGVRVQGWTIDRTSVDSVVKE